MCPKSIELWFEMRNRLLVSQTTVAANETYTSPRNSERVGFFFGCTSGNIGYAPAGGVANLLFGQFTISTATPFKPITIAEYGNLITEPWTFTFSAIGFTYNVYELYTPAWLVNRLMGK